MIKFKGTLPNYLSLFRLFAGPIIGIVYYFHNWSGFTAVTFEITWVLIYVIACLTDLFDGIIARKWPTQASDFGMIIDPVADKMLVISVMGLVVALGNVGYFEIACILLIGAREILISFARKPFIGSVNLLAVSRIGKWKALFQMFAVGFLLGRGGVIAEYFDKEVPYFSFEFIGTALLVVATAMTLWSGLGYVLSYFSRTSAKAV